MDEFLPLGALTEAGVTSGKNSTQVWFSNRQMGLLPPLSTSDLRLASLYLGLVFHRGQIPQRGMVVMGVEKGAS